MAFGLESICKYNIVIRFLTVLHNIDSVLQKDFVWRGFLLLLQPDLTRS